MKKLLNVLATLIVAILVIAPITKNIIPAEAVNAVQSAFEVITEEAQATAFTRDVWRFLCELWAHLGTSKLGDLPQWGIAIWVVLEAIGFMLGIRKPSCGWWRSWRAKRATKKAAKNAAQADQNDQPDELTTTLSTTAAATSQRHRRSK